MCFSNAVARPLQVSYNAFTRCLAELMGVTPCGIRAHNLRIRSPMPCPLRQGGLLDQKNTRCFTRRLQNASQEVFTMFLKCVKKRDACEVFRSMLHKVSTRLLQGLQRFCNSQCSRIDANGKRSQGGSSSRP